MSSASDQALWQDSISEPERIHHELLFYSQGPVDGYLSGERARDLFLHSRLPLTVLSQIWNLADVSNDNVLSVEEFVLAMHLILKVKEGLPIPRTLPKHLVPKTIPAVDISEISDSERTAYQNVFNKLSHAQIDAIQGRQLLLESALSGEELSHIWDLSDINRDGQLDRNEWNVSCHLVRHLKQGGKLSGPVNVFQLIPQCLSPVCYLARKHRVEEYNKKKHHLMTLKERRKSQIDSESRRLELLKKRFALHKELYEFSKLTEGITVPEEEYNLYKEKEESNIEKVEAVIYRLKKEHENIRQQTVKVILGEQGSLQEDARLVKLEQEDVRQKLATYHTKATKDPDPFHQLYELRRDLRKRSTLSEGEEPEVHFPFTTNPFDKESLQPKFSGHSIFISPNPRVFNNNNSHKEAAILKELCGFGDGFVEKWFEGVSAGDVDVDPIFMSINVPMDNRCWSGVNWSETGNEQVKGLHQKLVDLKIEMQKLNEDNGGQLLFRNPDDYLARQKAQEEEERLEKNRYQRRYSSEKRSDKDVSKRRSYIAPHTPDDDAQKLAREYRQKRRSLNLDKRSEHSDKQKTNKPTGTDSGSRKHSSSEKKSNEKPLKISTDSTDGFSPDSASSPRSSGVTSPRSATSPPRPSTKRKAAPPPPISTSTSSTPAVSSPALTKESPSSPPVQQTPVEASFSKPIPQPRSPQSKIPKPVTNQDPQNSTPSTPQNNSEQIASVQSELNTPHEIQQPSRPPRRKKKSEENKSFLHESFEKEQTRKSKEIALNVDLKDSPYASSNLQESKTVDTVSEPNSYDLKEDSLLDTIIKELPSFQSEKADKEVEGKQTVKNEVNVTVEEVIVANVDSGVECEIKPVKVDKPRGRLIESKAEYKIELQDKQVEPDRINADDSDEEKEFIINRQLQNDRKRSLESVEPENCIEHMSAETYNKRSEDLLQTFEKIAAYPNRKHFKDTKDTISIASDISVSSAGSEAPPLPDSAPPPLHFLVSSQQTPSLSENSQRVEVNEVIELENSKESETSPEMSEVPVITEKASPRDVVSPIDDLKASMFSMRVTSPTRDMTGGVHTNGELTVDTVLGKGDVNSDSDISDDGDLTGNFTPGEKTTRNVPVETNEDDGGIQLVSYNPKLNSPNSDQSGPDSAFEDMQSSMTSNDPLSNTIDDFSAEDYVTVEKVEKVEATPKKEGRSFVLEFDTDKPKGGAVLSPTSNKDFMAKAQQFADSVQRPPKMTVKLKREIQTPQDLTDERYLLLEAERRAVISSSTVKKKNVVSSVTYEEGGKKADGGKSDSETEENLENVRRKRIKELVKNIAGQKKKKKQLMENPKKKQRGTGRHAIYKLHLGWLHETRGKLRQVTARRGGGTRIYEFKKEEEQTVQTVINYATSIFFPDGKNDMGKISDMVVNLSTYNGEVISKFVMPNGEECNLQTYLKSIGVFSSQYFLYLRTSKKQEIDGREPVRQHVDDKSIPVPLTSLIVNDQIPGEICVKYTKLCNSSYTAECSQKICQTIDDCFLDTIVSDPDRERDGYNPLENSFKVTGITVNKISILSQADPSSNHFEYPTATSNAKGIIHSPDQIVGFEKQENREIILGVLYKEHNSGAYFQWYKNNELFASGPDLCLIPVTDPGEYLVKVSDEDTLYECAAVRVDSQALLAEKIKLSTNTCHATQDILTDRVRLQSLDDSTVDTAYVTEPSMEDSTVDTVTVTEPSVEERTVATVTEPSMEDKTVGTVTEPSMEDSTVDTVTEPSWEDSTVDSVTEPSMEDKTVDIVTVTERSTPSYDSITDNEVIKSHVMNENVSEQTNCDYFKERSSTAKYNPIHALNFSTDVNVPEIPYDSLCMGPKIGEGSFGTVHLAHYLFTPVAIKTVKIRRIKLVQKALEREVKVLSRVRHPHIILFMGYSVYNNALHIVSEYIKGSNLDDLLFGDRCQQIPLLKKCHIAEKISQAVAYLHNSSPIILHRDLKPENIIVSESLEVVKLCDLGISKLLTINSSATTYAPGMQPGTLIFQAPEILLGNRPASTKSDVWGMAGTLAELFSERPMWGLQEEDEEENERSAVETIKEFMSQKEVPHAITKLVQMDCICSRIVDIVTKGLNYDPDSRPVATEFPTKFSK